MDRWPLPAPSHRLLLGSALVVRQSGIDNSQAMIDEVVVPEEETVADPLTPH
jgi:hypothetical protein